MKTREGGPLLIELAEDILRQAGYRISPPNQPSEFGKNVRTVTRGEKSELALIQTRSWDDDARVVGVVLPDLRRVEFLILWLEHQKEFFKIPSTVLLDLHRRMAEQGRTRYTNNGRQWRINIYWDNQELSAQGSRKGERQSITGYVVDVP